MLNRYKRAYGITHIKGVYCKVTILRILICRSDLCLSRNSYRNTV